MLERYRFFKHLGFFGVEQQTAAATRQFLRTMRAHPRLTRATLFGSRRRGASWIVRERPLRLQSGLGALAAQSQSTRFFCRSRSNTHSGTSRDRKSWSSFGEPIMPGRETPGSASEWTERFSDALEETQDELAARSCRRDPAEWVVLNRGKSGVNSIYDALALAARANRAARVCARTSHGGRAMMVWLPPRVACLRCVPAVLFVRNLSLYAPLPAS